MCFQTGTTPAARVGVSWGKGKPIESDRNQPALSGGPVNYLEAEAENDVSLWVSRFFQRSRPKETLMNSSLPPSRSPTTPSTRTAWSELLRLNLVLP